MTTKPVFVLAMLCMLHIPPSSMRAQVTDQHKDANRVRPHVEQKWASVPNLPPNLKHDITAANQDWIDGLKSGNAELIGSAYAEDSVFCGVGGDCINGQVAVVAHYRDSIREFGRASDAFVRSDSLHIDRDLAYESGSAEAYLPNGAVRKGRFSTVWKLGPNGHWKIYRNMSLPAAGS